ncbi:hypothetical protein Hypma_010737 [Hypsizygus marmoreus]|uniref:Uncharacterized protein n=1 Tax=Hypsizygus marmoreus TaxID=39966 RepID=A0A369JTP8_HYPMA|nr:hypothetical protein Hypma_010737 [Hypsizygus marmoreus]
MVKTWRGRHEFSFNRASIPSSSISSSEMVSVPELNILYFPRRIIILAFLLTGAIYFAVMALANLANIMTFYSCGPFMRGGLSTFGSSLTPVLCDDDVPLMLNLHEAANAGIYSTTLSAFPSRNMEYHMPTGSVELNILGAEIVAIPVPSRAKASESMSLITSMSARNLNFHDDV